MAAFPAWEVEKEVAVSLEPLLDSTVYTNIRMIPFDVKTITWSVAFIYKDYNKLSAATKRFIDFIRSSC